MDIYKFNVTIEHGCDEWWDELAELTLLKRLEYLEKEITGILADVGIFATVKSNTWCQLELNLEGQIYDKKY